MEPWTLLRVSGGAIEIGSTGTTQNRLRNHGQRHVAPGSGGRL